MTSCPKAVLLVEDDPDIRESLRGILEDAGYAVEEASNGQEALTLLLGTLRPCLILLDLMMPVMNGLELLDRLPHTQAAAVPVIVITATQPKQPLQGALRVFRKPVQLDPLLDAVAEQCVKAS